MKSYDREDLRFAGLAFAFVTVRFAVAVFLFAVSFFAAGFVVAVLRTDVALFTVGRAFAFFVAVVFWEQVVVIRSE